MSYHAQQDSLVFLYIKKWCYHSHKTHAQESTLTSVTETWCCCWALVVKLQPLACLHKYPHVEIQLSRLCNCRDYLCFATVIATCLGLPRVSLLKLGYHVREFISQVIKRVRAYIRTSRLRAYICISMFNSLSSVTTCIKGEKAGLSLFFQLPNELFNWIIKRKDRLYLTEKESFFSVGHQDLIVLGSFQLPKTNNGGERVWKLQLGFHF